MTPSAREYVIAVVLTAASVAAAWLIPVVRAPPEPFILAVVVLFGLTLHPRAGLVGVIVGALETVVIRPETSVPAVVRLALFFLFGGAVVALKYGCSLAVEATTQYRL